MLIATTEQPVKENSLPQLDHQTFETQVVWLAVTFAFLYIVISRIALPKVDKVLEVRGEHIDGNLDKAEKLRSESEEIKASYEASLSSARAEAQKASLEVKESIQASISKATKELDDKLSKEADEAAARIAKAKDGIMSDLDTVATDVAVGLVEKLSGQTADEKAIKAVVNDKLAVVN